MPINPFKNEPKKTEIFESFFDIMVKEQICATKLCVDVGASESKISDYRRGNAGMPIEVFERMVNRCGYKLSITPGDAKDVSDLMDRRGAK